MNDDVKQMMLEDSIDLLDNVEVTTIADQCQKLKKLEDQILEAEEKVKQLKEKNLIDLIFYPFTSPI